MISTDVLVWFTGCCTSNYNSCYHKKYFANSRIKHLIIKRKKTSDSAANKRVIAVLLFIAYRWGLGWGVYVLLQIDCMIACLALLSGCQVFDGPLLDLSASCWTSQSSSSPLGAMSTFDASIGLFIICFLYQDTTSSHIASAVQQFPFWFSIWKTTLKNNFPWICKFNWFTWRMSIWCEIIW